MGAVMQTVSACEIDAGDMGSWTVDVAMPRHEELVSLNASVRDAPDDETRQAVIMQAMAERILAIRDLSTDDGREVLDVQGLQEHAGFYALTMMRAFMHMQDSCAGVILAGQQKNLRSSSTV